MPEARDIQLEWLRQNVPYWLELEYEQLTKNVHLETLPAVQAELLLRFLAVSGAGMHALRTGKMIKGQPLDEKRRLQGRMHEVCLGRI